MTFLAIAVVGVAAVCLVNLWLLIALARKVNKQADQFTQRPARQRPPVGPPAGSQVPAFTVTTAAGAIVSAADLHGKRSLIGFFSPGCEPCHEQVPIFAALAQRMADDAARPLAVICGGHRAARGQEGAADQLAAQLAEVAHVVREPSAGAVAAALAVSGFPSFILIDADGRVAGGAHAVAGIAGLAGNSALA